MDISLYLECCGLNFSASTTVFCCAFTTQTLFNNKILFSVCQSILLDDKMALNFPPKNLFKGFLCLLLVFQSPVCIKSSPLNNLSSDSDVPVSVQASDTIDGKYILYSEYIIFHFRDEVWNYLYGGYILRRSSVCCRLE